MNKLQQHSKICDELHNTYTKKNKDYGDSFGKTYRQLGIISAATRVSDKFNRFVNLAINSQSAEVKDETIEDTLLDMANYCIMTVIELRNSKINLDL